jgi:hypothetical protein
MLSLTTGPGGSEFEKKKKKKNVESNCKFKHEHPY